MVLVLGVAVPADVLTVYQAIEISYYLRTAMAFAKVVDLSILVYVLGLLTRLLDLGFFQVNY